jgi:glycosyltransferase involved in cell wall biosynthesis
VCPVYFDVESFRILRSRLLEVLEHDRSVPLARAKFVVVDDTGGRDPQMSELAEMPDVEVVYPPFNLGHQRALVYAIRSVSDRMRDEDVVLTLDADGEDKPEDLPRLLTPLLEKPDDLSSITLALRTQREESATFKLMYLCFRMMFRLLTGETVRTGNFAAFRGWSARRLLRHPYFDLCYSSTFISLGVPLRLVPCARGHRYAGKSHMTYSRLITHGMRMLMPFLDRIAVRALILFSLTFAAGMVMALVVLGIRVFTTTAIPGWATSTLLLVLTLCFVALGNFIVLFALFSQSRGISLANLEIGSTAVSLRSAPEVQPAGLGQLGR